MTRETTPVVTVANGVASVVRGEVLVIDFDVSYTDQFALTDLERFEELRDELPELDLPPALVRDINEVIEDLELSVEEQGLRQ